MKKKQAAARNARPRPARAPRAAPERAARDSEGRRGEIILATYHLIAEKGIEGLRTRDVAAKVGINISTLHYHFETKENLIAGAVDHVTHLFKTLRAPLDPGATALDELHHIFESQQQRRRTNPELEIVVNEIMVLARRDAVTRDALEFTLGIWRNVVEDILTRCHRDGYLQPELDPKTVAPLITSFLMGATMQLGLRTSFSLGDVSEMLVSLLVAPGGRRARKAR